MYSWRAENGSICSAGKSSQSKQLKKLCGYIFPGFESAKMMEYQFTIQIQMEFHQANGSISEQMALESAKSAHSLFESMDNIDFLVRQALSRGLPPFVVLDHFNLRRESPSSECGDIQKRILTYNRKEKSLAELSKKFLNKFQGADSSILALDQVTLELNVERRRIYDIINIMESLGVVSKIKKNQYQWKGLEKAIQTIELYQSGCCAEKKQTSRRQKSLQTLAGEFLRLFLTYKPILTLQEATNIILTEADDKVRKTKIRRLYDIVNVFKCLGLVRKVHIETGKNGFEWCGVSVLRQIIQEKKKNRFWVKSEEDSEECQFNLEEDEDEKENNPYSAEEQALSNSRKSCGLSRRGTTILSEADQFPKDKEPATEEKKLDTPRTEPLVDPFKAKVEQDLPLSYFEVLMRRISSEGEQTVSGLHKSLTGLVFSEMRWQR